MSFLSKNNKTKHRGRVGNYPMFGEDGELIDSGVESEGGGVVRSIISVDKTMMNYGEEYEIYYSQSNPPSIWGHYVTTGQEFKEKDILEWNDDQLKSLVYDGVEYVGTDKLQILHVPSYDKKNTAIEFNIKPADKKWFMTVAIITPSATQQWDTSHTYHMECDFQDEWDYLDCRRVGLAFVDKQMKADCSLKIEITEVKQKSASFTQNYIAVFDKVFCMGDSVTEGLFNLRTADGQPDWDNTVVKREFSYPSCLKRLFGLSKVYNGGYSGLTTGQYCQLVEDSKQFNASWGDDYIIHDDTHGRSNPDMTGYGAVIVCLGLNDLFQGVNPDQFRADLYNLLSNRVNRLMDEDAELFVCTLPTLYDSYADFHAYNEVIRSYEGFEMGRTNTTVHVLDMEELSLLHKVPAYNWIHPTALGYQRLAIEIGDSASRYIHNYPEQFKFVQFVGT